MTLNVEVYPIAWRGCVVGKLVSTQSRDVPSPSLNLPPNAVGKDYLPSGIARAPSGTGWQVSLFGMAGVLVALIEGIELQLLGLTAGIQFHPFAIKLPGLGTWPRWRRRPIRTDEPYG